jgi:hypothetical protein
MFRILEIFKCMNKKSINIFYLFFVFLQVMFSETYGQDYIKIDRLSFNTRQFSEMSPAFYQDGIVFCSNRKENLFIVTYNENNNFMYNLYWDETKKGGLHLSGAQKFSDNLNTRFNEGAVTFDSAQKVIYFTRTKDIIDKFGNVTVADSNTGIFTARKAGNDWTSIQPFPYNPDSANAGFPSLSPDGKSLYFSSDQAGGYGGYDIYVSELKNGRWQKPRNLGDKINTPKNEVSPFFHHSGRLYFASRGHRGKGGLDIFYSDKIDGKWKDPVDLSAPYNSKADDFGMIVNAAMDTGFFTSNRDGSDDIFEFYSTLPTFTSCKEQQKNDYCYVFYEPGSLDQDTTTFRYEWDLGDGTKIRGLEADHCFKGPGDYVIKLNVIDTLTGEIYFNQASYDLTVEDIEQPYITTVDTCSVNEKVRFDGLKTYLKNFDIDNYYWDFNDGTRGEDSITYHTFNRPGVYSVQLGVTSKTTGRKEKPKKECVTRKIYVIKNE